VHQASVDPAEEPPGGGATVGSSAFLRRYASGQTHNGRAALLTTGAHQAILEAEYVKSMQRWSEEGAVDFTSTGRTTWWTHQWLPVSADLDTRRTVRVRRKLRYLRGWSAQIGPDGVFRLVRFDPNLSDLRDAASYFAWFEGGFVHP